MMSLRLVPLTEPQLVGLGRLRHLHQQLRHHLHRVVALEEHQSALVLRAWMVPGYAIGTPLHHLQVVAPVQHPSVVVLLASMESGLVGHRLNPTLQFVLEPTAQVKTRK